MAFAISRVSSPTNFPLSLHRHAGMHGPGRRAGLQPDLSRHQPRAGCHNPFPQLNKVAIAPFFNQSNEPTVDGRKFALAYFAELQAVPGFEVVPLGVVETAIVENQVNLANPGRARRLANILALMRSSSAR